MSDPTSIPPASFDFLVLSLRYQAESSLGLAPGPDGQIMTPNLAIARHAIDTLSVLEEKTRGNLSVDEKRLLENSLVELRYRFVQVQNAQATPSESGS
jgi:hypothetical protein